MIVEVDGQEYEFPDSMTQDQIRDVLRNKFGSQAQPQNNVLVAPPPQPEMIQETEVVESVPLLEGGARSLGQGLTFGFGDEIISGLAALPAAALTDMSVKEAYNQSLQNERARQNQFAQEQPLIDIGSQIAGGIATGGGLASLGRAAAPKAMGALSNYAAANPFRFGAGVGGASGSLYGFGSGEGGALERAEDALLGGAIGLATGGVGGAITGRLSRAPNPERLTADQLRQQASVFYQKARETGGILKPNLTDDFIKDARVRILPSTDEGKMLAGKNALVDELLERLDTFQGKPITLEGAQEMDEIFGDYVSKFVRPNGTLEKEGKKILDVQSAFRDMIDGAADSDVIGGKAGFESIKEGRKLWSRSAKLRDIENIIERAEMMDNPATAIRTGFRQLVNNKKKLRGYSEAEIEAMKKAADSGVVGEVLRTMGSRLVPIIAGGAGAVSGGGALGAAAAAQGASMAARGLGTRMRVNQANSVADLIANPNARKSLSNPSLVSKGGLSGSLLGNELID